MLGSHCLTEGLPCHAPLGAVGDCGLCIIHREIAVATHLLVSLLKAPQARVKTAIAEKRLRQIKADFPVLSVQPDGELRDEAVGPSPGLLTMPSNLPFLVKSVPSILAAGVLRMSDFLQVGTGKLFARLKGLLPYLHQ